LFLVQFVVQTLSISKRSAGTLWRMSTNQIQHMANKKQQEDHEYTTTTTTSKKQTWELLDPVEMLPNPRLRLYIACIVAVTPFIVSGLLFVSSLDSVALQFLLGAVLGLLLTFSYQFIALYRTHLRNIKVRIHVQCLERYSTNCIMIFSRQFSLNFFFFLFYYFFSMQDLNM
jgi:hypothetical protein